MHLLADLVDAVMTGRVEVVDLTAPLSSQTPVIVLPEPFGQTDRFELHEISRYDDRGPAWYWNNISTGEHTGTHFDAPVRVRASAGGQMVVELRFPDEDALEAALLRLRST